MRKIIEFIPNISEGKNKDVINALVKACKELENKYYLSLVDYSSDSDHNRSVFTFIGDLEGIEEVSIVLCKEALKLIDLNKHVGKHPRIGAVDVMPYVPLENVTIEECVELSKKIAKRISEELNIPIYLYEYSCTREWMRNLADVRRGEFENIDQKMLDEKYYPDFGPKVKHPTFGAIALGVRDFLIAYNINLNTNDVRIAKKIAKQIRESSGGLKCVKALGIYLEEKDIAQVSMNLTNFNETSVFEVYTLVKKLCENDNIEIIESELIGLIPNNALINTSKEYLKLNCDLNNLTIESKINSIKLNILDKSLNSFLDQLSSNSPTPGGGSVASIVGGMGEGLIQMVTNFTLNKEKYKDVQNLVLSVLLSSSKNLQKFKKLALKDIELYGLVSSKYKLPNKTAEEKQRRKEEINKALMLAKEPPFELLVLIKESINTLNSIYKLFNKNLISDFAVASKLLEAAADSAYVNVIVNEKSISSSGNIDKSTLALNLRDEIRELANKIYNDIVEIILK